MYMCVVSNRMLLGWLPEALQTHLAASPSPYGTVFQNIQDSTITFHQCQFSLSLIFSGPFIGRNLLLKDPSQPCLASGCFPVSPTSLGTFLSFLCSGLCHHLPLMLPQLTLHPLRTLYRKEPPAHDQPVECPSGRIATSCVPSMPLAVLHGRWETFDLM